MGNTSTVVLIIYLAIIVLMIASQWKVYNKAGQPGWAVLIPIFNLIVLLKIVEKPLWWIILLLIPIVNIVIAFIINIALAEKFGRTSGFGVGLTLLPFIFWPMLGFGDDEYEGEIEPII